MFVPLLIIWKCVPLVDLLNTLLWAEWKGPATHTRYFAFGMQLSPALQSPFLSTWGVVMLIKKKNKNYRVRWLYWWISALDFVSQLWRKICGPKSGMESLGSTLTRSIVMKELSYNFMWIVLQARIIHYLPNLLHNFTQGTVFWLFTGCEVSRSGLSKGCHWVLGVSGSRKSWATMTRHLLIELDVEGQMAKLEECAMDYCISSIRHRPQIVIVASICGTLLA